MATTYPLNLPNVRGLNNIKLRAVNIVGVSPSIFTFQTETFVHAGQRWEADIRIPPLVGGEASGPWTAFLTKLKGKQGSFLLGDPARVTARGSAATTPGSPVVNGAGQTGETINISGAPASAANYLMEGDYVQFGSGLTATLHMILEDASADGSGQIALELWPDVRSALTSGSVVVVSNARGVFRLDSNVADWTVNLPAIYGINFGAEEVI